MTHTTSFPSAPPPPASNRPHRPHRPTHASANNPRFDAPHQACPPSWGDDASDDRFDERFDPRFRGHFDEHSDESLNELLDELLADPLAGPFNTAFGDLTSDPCGEPSLPASGPAQGEPSRPFTMMALLDSRPLRDLDDAEFEEFLYASRMYPSRSRFMPGNAEWLAPRRDITVRVALETLRERMQQAVASAELVARLERDYQDESPLPDDDEALLVAAAVRDNLREALGMLGVIERALARESAAGDRDVSLAPSSDRGWGSFPEHEVREPVPTYRVLALAA
ncbi:hypothetical protein OU995_08735 [Roseateles sp. SL47]|uniref:hypothetical protein n=1 Tax=Roseateles sp. SL47 TaxID=2995138 RepID=UPI002271884D|nr:hypothetical protein [Roseateles sp. SL47]WAC74770.1 hypothetical protein OU995_08735 [Roseateles sp. SL47]